MTFSVETSDYLHTRGRTAYLAIGPFGFAVDTADGVGIAFSVRIGRWRWSWDFGNAE